MSRKSTISRTGFILAQMWAATASADDLTKFYATYNDCDAKLLAGSWSASQNEAKTRAGRKLSAGAAAVIEDALKDARKKGAQCQFHETGFAYDDAEALSKLWGVSVTEAKNALASKATSGDRALAKQVIAEARKKGGGTKPNAPAGDVSKFVAKYNYCDAKILASVWGEGVEAAKVFGHQKIANGNVATLEQVLAEGRKKGTACEFHETGFAYADAEALSKHWKVSIDEAKTALASKLTAGDRALAKQVVAEAKGKPGKSKVKPRMPAGLKPAGGQHLKPHGH